MALSKFDPELSALRAAAAERLRARFPVVDERALKAGAAGLCNYDHATILFNMAKVLSLRATANLAQDDVASAMEDITLILRLSDALAGEPALMSWRYRKAITSEALRVIWEGLQRHQWADEHLAELEEQLGRINVVEHFQRAVRGERLLYVIPTLRGFKAADSTGISPGPPNWMKLFKWYPRGWDDQNRATCSRLIQLNLDSLHPAERRVDPAQAELVLLSAYEALTEKFPPYAFATIVCLHATESADNCAQVQTILHLACIALRLERHYLRHYSYPSTLAEVDGEVHPPGQPWPHDAGSGRPPHYVPREDGSFLLYFDDWKQPDDPTRAPNPTYRAALWPPLAPPEPSPAPARRKSP